MNVAIQFACSRFLTELLERSHDGYVLIRRGRNSAGRRGWKISLKHPETPHQIIESYGATVPAVLENALNHFLDDTGRRTPGYGRPSFRDGGVT